MRIRNDVSLHLPANRLKFLFARNAHIVYSECVESMVNPIAVHE